MDRSSDRPGRVRCAHRRLGIWKVHPASPSIRLPRGRSGSPVPGHRLGRSVQQHGGSSGDVRAVRAGIGFIFQQFNLVADCRSSPVLTGMLFRIPGGEACRDGSPGENWPKGSRRWPRLGCGHAGSVPQPFPADSSSAPPSPAVLQRLISFSPTNPSLPSTLIRPHVMEILAAINREQGLRYWCLSTRLKWRFRYCLGGRPASGARLIYDGPSTDLTPVLLRELYGAAPMKSSTPTPPVTPIRSASVGPPGRRAPGMIFRADHS